MSQDQTLLEVLEELAESHPGATINPEDGEGAYDPRTLLEEIRETGTGPAWGYAPFHERRWTLRAESHGRTMIIYLSDKGRWTRAFDVTL